MVQPPRAGTATGKERPTAGAVNHTKPLTSDGCFYVFLYSLFRTQDEQSSALSGFEERLGGLVAENQALRAENDRLRRVY